MPDSGLLEALKRLPLYDGGQDPLAVHHRMARRGALAPESMDLFEIKQVCHALETHYAVLGLS